MIDAWYMLPYHLARQRRHPYADTLGVLNLFLGWTILGWLISLLFAWNGPLVVRRIAEEAVVGHSPGVN